MSDLPLWKEGWLNVTSRTHVHREQGSADQQIVDAQIGCDRSTEESCEERGHEGRRATKEIQHDATQFDDADRQAGVCWVAEFGHRCLDDVDVDDVDRCVEQQEHGDETGEHGSRCAVRGA